MFVTAAAAATAGDGGFVSRKGISALHCAAAEGHLDVMQLLLAAGAAVNVQDQRYRRTPVFLASEAGRVDMVSELIHHGAKLNVIDKYGCCALAHVFVVYLYIYIYCTLHFVWP
jgi:ankyrin repeat protein